MKHVCCVTNDAGNEAIYVDGLLVIGRQTIHMDDVVKAAGDSLVRITRLDVIGKDEWPIRMDELRPVP